MSVKRSVNALKSFGGSVNCFIKDGVLKAGFKCVDLVSDRLAYPGFVAYSEFTKGYFACSETGTFISPDGRYFHRCADYDGSNAFIIDDFIDGAARTIFIFDDKALIYNGDGVFSIENMNEILHCGVMHRGRLFGAVDYTVKWSGPGGFDDWAGGVGGSGFVTLDPARGRIRKLFEFDGKLIAVRDFGLTVLNMRGSPENFTVGITDTDCEPIYYDSVCVSGDKLCFYCDSGIKCFDGNKITSIKTRHSDMRPWTSAAYKGKYYLGGRNTVLDRDIILCVDLEDGESCIIDDVADVIFVKGGIRIFNGSGQKQVVEGGRYTFESGAIDFGTDRYKTVTEIKVTGKAQVSLSNGRYTRHFLIENGTINPHLRGKSFTVTVRGEDEVREVILTAEVPNDV